MTSIKQPGEEGHHGHGACVYFEGISRPTPSPWDPNTTSRTRGMVQLTQEGEVRWTMYSVYWGEERWKSEGIQIGGENSRRGVFGFWFEKLVVISPDAMLFSNHEIGITALRVLLARQPFGKSAMRLMRRREIFCNLKMTQMRTMTTSVTRTTKINLSFIKL